MKKSKLIVPAALAVMLLSTAASVTGTVAWFTANRAVDIDASQFAVTTTDGNLTVLLEAGANSVINANGRTVEVAKYTDNNVENNLVLTDSSVDISNLGANNAETAVVYTNDGDTFTEYTPDSYVIVAPGSATEKYPSGLDHVVLCVSWKMTFKYEFSQNNLVSNNLFFDIEKSAFSQVDTSNSLETGKGFRIGMASQQSCLVWADQEKLINCNYVTGTSSIDEKDPIIFGDDPATTSVTEVRNAPGYYTAADETANSSHKKGTFNGTDANYAAYTLVSATSRNNATKVNLLDNSISAYTAADGAFPRATDTTANQTQRGDYLGTFDPANRNTTTNVCDLVVYCYAWFEGSDPYVVNASVMNTMAASLHFYTRKAA